MKQANTGTILSITTGILLCEFGRMHKLAEHVLGHPIFTHEFADKKLWEKLRDIIIAQHPQLAEVDASKVDRDNWRAFLDAQEQRFGLSLPIAKGDEKRTKGPLQTWDELSGGKPAIGIMVDDVEADQ